MNTGKAAEQYVKSYFHDKDIELVSITRGNTGYDFKKSDDTLFIEVKGTTFKDLSKIPFRYFTNSEYEMAKLCRKRKIKYEIHLITGIGTNNVKHYIMPGNVLLEKSKPEVNWSLPIRNEFHKYLIKE
jgi:hypothetical protein